MSGNPNPQHVPTDGLGVAAYIRCSGTNLTNRANGGLTVAGEANANDTTGLNGQGYGAVQSSNHPVAQYHLIASLSGKTIGGTAYTAANTITAALYDAKNNSYSPADATKFTVKSWNNPNAGTPSWYRPSPFGSYTADVVSISNSSGTLTVTGLALGQGVVEVRFPTFEETWNEDSSSLPEDFIYAQIVVDVVA